ncbi:MAG: cupin domain-containing protein [Planctomycetes bacterium]|nr:cupin domain-containing protein [Planctomycetota bacterium]
MQTRRIDDEVEFRPKTFLRKRLFATGEMHFNMYCLQPGQNNPLHRHPMSAEILFFVEGEGEIIVGSEMKRVAAREAVYVPVNAAHEITNTGKSNMIVVLVQTPLPCEHVLVRPEEMGEIAEIG